MNSTESNYHYSNKKPHTNSWLLKPIVNICNNVKAHRILEIGCGNGYLAKALVEQGFEVVGFDPSESGINIAKKICPDGKFFQMSIYDDPANLDCTDFDVVISTEVIEHLFYPQKLFQFAGKKLRGDGRLIISTPYHGYWKNLALSILNKWDFHHSALWDGGHIKFWSVKTLRKIFQQNDFLVEGFKGIGRVPYFWTTMIMTGKMKQK